MVKRSVTVLAVAALLHGAAHAQMKGFSDADAKELAAYRLTLPTLSKVAVAMRASISEMKKDPKFQEMAKIEAEIEALQEKEELTEADEKRLMTLEARKESLEDSLGGAVLNDAGSLDDMEAQLRKTPAMMAGLNKAGLSPREFSKFMLSMVQAGMVAGFKKAGMLKEIPKEVPPENVKFVEEHEAELKALQQEMQAAAGKSGGQ